MHGHITSLAVARTHRKLGLATKLMNAAREQRGSRGGVVRAVVMVIWIRVEQVQMQGGFASQECRAQQRVACQAAHPLERPSQPRAPLAAAIMPLTAQVRKWCTPLRT